VLGRFLFRWRGVIGVLGFGVVFWPARPTFGSCLLGAPFLIAGLAVRFWASGYIGIAGRVREIGARQRIVSGPYRLLRHPLYIGNFLLVVGMLVAMRPAVWLGAVVVVGFVAEYTFIVVAEEAYLAGRRCNAKCKMQDAEGKMADVEEEGWSEKLEAGSDSAEAGMAERGRSQKSEGRGQKAEAQADRRSPESTVDRAESFRLSRALVEWRTWAVTGAVWGLAVLRVLVTK
jgi:hypothetical protein